MALNISYINQEAPSPKVKVDQRLYRTADNARLVPEGHPDAAFLYCTPGHEVSREEFERFELDPSLEAEAAETKRRTKRAKAPETEATAEKSDQGEPEGSAEGQADDAEAAAESEAGEQPEGAPGTEGEAKAVDGPPEDKAVRKRRTKKAKG